MNILFVGAGKGSWEMRGLQLAAALGAKATAQPTREDWAWANVAVLVKRHGLAYAQQAHLHGLPVVWDALDFWAQPSENGRAEFLCRGALRQQAEAICAHAVIGATQAQAFAAPRGYYLPHHSWSGLVPTPPRPQVRVVAYQGGAAFLGAWLGRISRACVARGWRFEVNPQDLAAADILVSYRDGPWDGWACREWKSGVKAVNAQAAGRPIIGQATAARRELLVAGSVAETPEEFEAALDYWTPLERRERAYEGSRLLAPAYMLSAVAEQYSRILEGVRATCMTAG